jgi:hypothetical protein
MNKLVKQQNLAGIINTLPNTNSKELNIYNAHISSKKLKDFSTSKELAFVNSLIVRWAKYIGVKTPDSVDLNLLANFIKKNFPSFNAYDLQECIELITLKELDTQAIAYGEISASYVSEVFKAYQQHKMDVVFKVRQEIEKIKQKEVKPIPTNERISNFKRLLMLAKEDNVKGLFYIDAGDSIYNFIKYNKLMPITKGNIDQDLIDEAMVFGEKEYQRKLKEKVTQSVIKHNSFKSVSDLKYEKDDMIRKNAREFIVNRWLSKIDLTTFLQKINVDMLKY